MRTKEIIIKILLLLLSSTATGNLRAESLPDNEENISDSVDNEYKTPEELIAGMTDEEIRHYSDSIKDAWFPPAEIITYDGSPIDFPSDDGSQVPIWIDNPHVPKSISIDTTKEIGAVDVISGYTQTGAKTYDIPINIFPGINGLTPQLSLHYNSQQGNSVYGYGWSLSGVSAISRASNDVYHDGAVREMRYDNNDAFVLDGIRLIKLSSASDHIIYQTETGNIKVKAHCSASDIGFFEVFYPDGRHANYGWSSNQKNPLQYPLTTVADIFGNKITFTYTVSDNHYYINSIDYNGARISFKYKERSDPIITYRCGVKLYEPKLLEEITCFLENTLWSRYSLEHIQRNNASLLSAITYSSPSKSFNPIRFYYGEGITDKTFKREQTQLGSWFTTEKPNKLRILRGKYSQRNNTEGIVMLPIRDPYYKRMDSGNNYCENLYNENQKILLFPSLDTSLSQQLELTTGKGFVDILSVDIDGIGYDKLIKINNNVINDRDVVTFTIYKYSDLSNNFSIEYTREYSFATVYTDKNKHKSINPKFYYTGDFNGDGRTDILAVSSNEAFGSGSETTTCYIFDLVKNQIIYQGKLFKYYKYPNGIPNIDEKEVYNFSDKLLTFDYDGDGKTDICLIDRNELAYYTFNISSNIITGRKVSYNSSVTIHNTLRDKYLYPGDFNGDGLVDILVSPDKTGNLKGWNQYNSTGKTSFDLSSYEIASAKYSETEGFIIQDVNNDGKSDFIKYSPTGFMTFLSDGTKACVGIGTETGFNGANSILVPIDINNMGNNTKLIGIKDGIVTKYIFSRDDSRDRMITGMANSLGIVECNTYHAIDDKYYEYIVHDKGFDASFPYINIEVPIQVVAKTETFLNGNKIESKKFKYQNAVANRQGLGFCGFQKITITDLHDRTIEESYDPYNFRVKTGEKSAVSESKYEYLNVVSKNKIALILLSNRLDIDKLRNDSVKSRYYYDTYGSLIREYISYPSGLEIAKINSFKNNDITGAGYYIGLLDENTVTKTKDDIIIQERTYVQSFNKVKPTSVVTTVNDFNVRKHTYSYDSYGNITSEIFSKYSSSTNHSKSFSYDKYGRLTKKVDVLGLSEEYQYNNNGVLMTSIDVRGNSSSFSYDSFRRPLKSQYPDGRSCEVKRGWGYTDIGGLYYVTESFSDSPSYTRVYNALDQEIRRINTRFNGSKICTDRRYDNYGRLSQVSLPFKEGENPSLWDTYEYDAHDRIVKIREASGRITSYSYSGKSISTTIDNVTTTRVYDEFGNLIEATDPVTSIKYELRPDGRPMLATAHGAVITKYAYDEFERLSKYTDPSLGTIIYRYDRSGNLSEKIDGNGKSIKYTYDSNDYITKVTAPELYINYTYNKYGDIIEKSSSNGTKKTTTYDTFGRPLTIRETGLDGVFLQKDLTYTSGNLSSTKYTSHKGFLTTETYSYANGFLIQTKLSDGTTVYKPIVENGLGLTTKATFGNCTNSYSYDQFGSLTGNRVTKGSEYKCSSDYIFNSMTGNLTSLTDHGTGKTKKYSYDSVNRLTNDNGITISYDKKGNISKKSDTGNFIYGLHFKPYCITGITNPTNSIGLDKQTVTYSSFERPTVISEGDFRADLSYDTDFDRVSMSLRQKNGLLYKKHYLGGCYEFDMEGSTYREKLYLGGGYYDSPLVYVKTPAKGEHFHIVRDYLGSITEIINSAGTIVERLRYNAWGQRINPSTSQPYEYGKEPELFLGRGYTGHEHIPQFGLINMNARLYDPALGRFLSPDPYIQDEDNPQNWNRYTYALNNPLKYIDRDGEFWWIVAGAAVGGVFNLFDKAMSGQINSFSDGLLAFGVGAVSGAIGTFAGGLGFGVAATALGTTGGFVAGAAAGFVSSVASIPTLSLGNHLAFGDPMVTAEEYALGIALGSFTGGMNGGLSSKLISNENFWVGSYVPKTNLYLSLNSGGAIGIDNSEIDLTYFASKANQFKGMGKYGGTAGGKSKPLQRHHFATDKNKTYTPKFEKIVRNYGLKLNDDWNIELLPHQGRHPNNYHEWVLHHMNIIEQRAVTRGDFIKLFREKIIEPIRLEPERLYKKYYLTHSVY